MSHYKQYPPKTEYLLSYFESRGGKYPTVIFFGLQYILKKWLQYPITMEMVKEADEFYMEQFATDNTKVFNREGWEYIVKEHEGKIPVLIKAVPEGKFKTFKQSILKDQIKLLKIRSDRRSFLSRFEDSDLIADHSLRSFCGIKIPLFP